MDFNQDMAAIGYDRGGWHGPSQFDERLHLTSTHPVNGAQHQYLEPGDPVRMLGRAAVGLSLGGPFSNS